MGANVKVEGNSATIEGVEKLSGARVSAPDLRAGAAGYVQQSRRIPEQPH